MKILPCEDFPGADGMPQDVRHPSFSRRSLELVGRCNRGGGGGVLQGGDAGFEGIEALLRPLIDPCECFAEFLAEFLAEGFELPPAFAGDSFGHRTRLNGGDFALVNKVAERGFDLILGDHCGADTGEQCFLDDIDHSVRNVGQF